MVNIAITGFGRIGRLALRVILLNSKLQKQLKVVAINTSGSMPISAWAHLLKNDTTYGRLGQPVKVIETQAPDQVTDNNPLLGYFIILGQKYPVLAQRDPAKLPWRKYRVNVVIEATGAFKTEKLASAHLKAGAKKILISAPGKEGNIGSYVLGVNKYQGGHKIADNASCTTNCVAPISAIIHSKFGIKKGFLTTIHAYTDSQNLQDGSHKDLRRARAAAQNMIPSSTGAAKATVKTIPDLKGRFDASAMRVPVITGSISDLTFLLARNTSVAEINATFKAAAANPLYKGIIAVSQEPLVSSDIIGRSESAIIDLALTKVVGGNLVKIFAWYDNEWGYSSRLVEQAIQVGEN